MPVYDSIVDCVGRTPLVRLGRIAADVHATILAKVESRNPCASIKDRIGVAMIRAAEKDGSLKPGATIVEATSGNTGIALAFACAALGYKLMITMPENMSRERIALLRLLGAEVVLTRGGQMREAVTKAEEIASTRPNTVLLRQFENPANPEVHRRTTAQEIWEDTGGDVDVFVAGVGTGGTITGVGEVLKDKRPEVRVVAVEPAESAVLSGNAPGPHYIQGIGAGFVPAILNRDIIDEILPIAERAAIDHMKRLCQDEGILAGVSSGAAVCAALRIGRRAEMAGKTIVVVLPDSGERYVSTSVTENLV